MERPSHSNFKISHPFSRRFTTLGLAVSFPLAVGWALSQGLGGQVIRDIVPILHVHVDEQVKPRTPPPPVKFEDADTFKPVQPEFTIEQDQQNDAIAAPDRPPPTSQSPEASNGPDRPASGVMSTHTIPPYPLLAQRMGAEGKVTLRLTVLADGTVGKAEIIASSGRSDLDEAARQWIVDHWTYRPALDKGQPAASQTLATVMFRLQNAR